MCVFFRLCRSARRSLPVVMLSAILSGTAVADISSAITDAASGQPVLYPSYLAEYDGLLYFRGRVESDLPPSVTGLWRTDGYQAYRIAGIGPGTSVSDPSYLAAHDGTLYFAAASAGPPRLWQYNSATGASQAPGSSSNLQNPEEMTSYGGNLYFRAARFGAPSNIGIELWKFDGTNQTPIDMYPGTGSSYPQHFIQYNGLLYFNANGTPGQGTELWRYNGTGMPTEAARIYPNNGSSPENFAIFNNQLYFSAYDGVHGRELWRYDETNGPWLAADIVPGGQYSSSNPNNLCVYQNKLYFSAYDSTHGYELWSYDGSQAHMVAEINPTPDPLNGDTFLMDSSPANLTVYNGLLYFSADDGAHGRELWSFDGTTPRMVADINLGPYGSEVSNLTVYNGRLFFTADDGYVPGGLHELQPKAFLLEVPEPGTAALAAAGALAALAYAWCKRKNQGDRL